jgi:drug/metabolite transporter (DMT)-like permease
VSRLADTTPASTSFFRCLLALPVLLPLAAWERRKGPRPLAAHALAVGAGAFLGVDLVLWTHAIYDIGAGIATVLANIQVLFVTGIAWVLLGERPRRRFAVSLPIVLGGVILLAGTVGAAPRSRPVAGVLCGLGASVSYAVFLLLLRRSTQGSTRVAGPLADATIGAGVAALVLGLALGEMRFAPSAHSLAWLVVLALTSQTLGWLLITSSLPRLPAAMSSLLLLFQPVASMGLAALVLAERPTLLQLLGVVLVCGGVLVAARARSPERTPVPSPTAT